MSLGGEIYSMYIPPTCHFSISLSHTQDAGQGRLSNKQLFPRVTASALLLSIVCVTSYKSLTPPLMIALQWSLKGTLAASTHKQPIRLFLSLVSLFVYLSLSQEPQGHLGYMVVPNTKVKHLTGINQSY